MQLQTIGSVLYSFLFFLFLVSLGGDTVTSFLTLLSISLNFSEFFMHISSLLFSTAPAKFLTYIASSIFLKLLITSFSNDDNSAELTFSYVTSITALPTSNYGEERPQLRRSQQNKI